MKRKALQDVANSLAVMAIAGESPSDLEVLSEIPDGALHIDLINGSASHDRRGTVELEIVARLSGWLRARLEALSIPMSAIQVASIRVEYRTDRVPTNRSKVVSFDWRSETVLATDEKEYRGQIAEKHCWHTRQSAA